MPVPGRSSRLLDLRLRSARLERALAADLATTLIAHGSALSPLQPWAPAFDGTAIPARRRRDRPAPLREQRSRGFQLAALVAPDRFEPHGLTTTSGPSPTPKETRERRIYALAGLAGLGAAVLPGSGRRGGGSTADVRERLMLGLGAATLGDAQTASSVLTSLVEAFGEGVGDQARLRVGEDAADVTAATALMAMLMASTGDPVASRYRAYVEANPSPEALGALHKVGYMTWVLEHRAPQSASFAYDVDGSVESSSSRPGESFRLKLTKAQLARSRSSQSGGHRSDVELARTQGPHDPRERPRRGDHSGGEAGRGGRSAMTRHRGPEGHFQRDRGRWLSSRDGTRAIRTDPGRRPSRRVGPGDGRADLRRDLSGRAGRPAVVFCASPTSITHGASALRRPGHHDRDVCLGADDGRVRSAPDRAAIVPASKITIR